ncbi:MAG: porphobilinogen synthase [Deltaproteobacteria bacterium]|jgi:porphobilinogen synthase|nr:porphobilinogen synthase [Deltaproteobacteria bacterium]
MNDFFRGRRLRSTPALRALVGETRLAAPDLIMPYFVVEAKGSVRKPINSMPGQNQLSLDELDKQVARATDLGLRACLLFGIPAHKDPLGGQAYDENGIVQRAIRRLKRRHGAELVVIADTCLCEYTSHGHCGVLLENGVVDNDPSLELLAKAALAQARAGADVIAPSDMMDGRVAAIRQALDVNGFNHIPIMSYAAKYASAYYGPFREAAESAPKSGDRKSYQMDPANAREAMREVAADALEGADMLIVKPAGPYLDILRQTRDAVNLPLAAYQVSGEYSLIRAAAQLGWVDEDRVVMESLIGIKRAGADMLITYFSEMLLEKGLAR